MNLQALNVGTALMVFSVVICSLALAKIVMVAKYGPFLSRRKR